ncbi:MAG: PAS domain S-box protein [Oligoflexales bacterium]|nr:PAS domain S-box protein [Oligoflexales bacterium]
MNTAKKNENPDSHHPVSHTGLHVTHEIVVQLERSKRASENLVYNLPELVLIIDQNARILKANKAVEKLLDAKSGSLIYSNLSRFFSDASWEHFKENIKSLEQNTKVPITNFDQAIDGFNLHVKHYHWNVRRIIGLSNRRGPLFYVVGHDITEIRLMFEKIQESHASLESHSLELEHLLEKVQKQKVQIIESSKLAQLGPNQVTFIMA